MHGSVPCHTVIVVCFYRPLNIVLAIVMYDKSAIKMIYLHAAEALGDENGTIAAYRLLSFVSVAAPDSV